MYQHAVGVPHWPDVHVPNAQESAEQRQKALSTINCTSFIDVSFRGCMKLLKFCKSQEKADKIFQGTLEVIAGNYSCENNQLLAMTRCNDPRSGMPHLTRYSVCKTSLAALESVLCRERSLVATICLCTEQKYLTEWALVLHLMQISAGF